MSEEWHGCYLLMEVVAMSLVIQQAHRTHSAPIPALRRAAAHARDLSRSLAIPLLSRTREALGAALHAAATITQRISLPSTAPASAAGAIAVDAPPATPAHLEEPDVAHFRFGRAWTWVRSRRLTHVHFVALLATMLSIAAYVWYAVNGDTLAYGDAVSHMMIARRVLFAPTPGLGQFGAVWPPFSHMLMLPFVWINPLYRSGLAGAIPSMASYIVATVYLFRSAKLLFSSAGAGWVAAAIFALNPNILYLQSTPMTELVLLGTIIFGLFYLFRWVEYDHPLDLVICAAALAAGTLVRYDAWALAAAELLVVAFVAWKRHGLTAAESVVWLYGLLAFVGVAAWLLYNWILWGDPLYFLDGPYSAKYQEDVIKAQGGLPTYHNLALSVREYLQVAADLNFWPLLALAALGLVVALVRFRFSERMLPVYAVWALLAFNVLALFLGITVIYTPQIHLPHVTLQYFNMRYGVMAMPEIALFVASLIPLRRELIVVGLALALIFSGFNPGLGIPYSLLDPLKTTPWAATRQQAQWLDQHYHGGTILIGGAPRTALIFTTGLPDHDFLNENTPGPFDQAIAAPQKYATWIVMDSSPGAVYDAVQAHLRNRTDWRTYYVLRVTIDGVQFYQRIQSPPRRALASPQPAPSTRSDQPPQALAMRSRRGAPWAA